ncbi:MAG: SEC-C metal-binding domain-containing protein, partial [bacterium]|nr:SEC-C metal-binding domain-containing protein [bacterium]
IFGSDRIKGMMEKLGMEENEPIEHPWITKAIANAQKRVEGHNFEIRKNLLEYDDVMNQQRTTVYRLRRDILEGVSTRDKLLDHIDQLAATLSSELVPEKASPGEIDQKSLEERVFKQFDLHLNLQELPREKWTTDGIGELIYKRAFDFYEGKEKQYGEEAMRSVEKMVFLATLDNLWKDHLLSMDHLREGIGLRGYGQKDPLLEYKREGFGMFQTMLHQFWEDVIERVFRIQISEDVGRTTGSPLRRRAQQMTLGRGTVTEMGRGAVAAPGQGDPVPTAMQKASGAPVVQETIVREGPKTGRNDPCPCGSGKKFKKCCGK